MIKEKIEKLVKKITAEQQDRLVKSNLGCQANLNNAIASYKVKSKYTYIDIGHSGRYMIENETGNIYGIKAYGVINKKHFYGNLDNIDDYYFGQYRALKIK